MNDAKVNVQDVEKDPVVAFLSMTEEEKILVVKKDISKCVTVLGYYISGTSIKQLAKVFGTPERYKQICSYEDQYTSIVQSLLKPVPQND